MKERPILFNGPMVRAILDDTKTQTRRPIITQYYWSPDMRKPEYVAKVCPHGGPGDRLWVRETWKASEIADGTAGIFYQADNSFIRIPSTAEDGDRWLAARREPFRWRPSIHMPRWTSRILLEIETVRVERVQDITEEDCEAEGIQFMREIPDADETLTSVQLFKILWDHIYSKRGYPWSLNPWVWVVQFRRIKS